MRLACEPVADLGGGHIWFVVEEPDGVGDVTAIARLPSGPAGADLKMRTALDLRVAVRYDPSMGLYYLEVLGTV